MNVPTVVSLRSARPSPTCPFASDSGSMKNCGERCCARAPRVRDTNNSGSAAQMPVYLLRVIRYFPRAGDPDRGMWCLAKTNQVGEQLVGAVGARRQLPPQAESDVEPAALAVLAF